MAISPKQLEESFQKEVSLFEQHFDNILAKNKITKGQSITIIDIPRNFDLAHLALLKPRYIQAGWVDVIWNNDQREGNFLTFKY